MEAIVAKIYVHEIDTQCRFAQFALADLRMAIRGLPSLMQPSAAGDRTDRIWCSVQALLVSGGNVSKYLWPGNRKKNDQVMRRCEFLRNALKIPQDTATLFKSIANLRNDWEHLDDRFDCRLVGGNLTAMLAHRNIGPKNAIAGYAKRMFHLDPTVETLSFDEHEVTITDVERGIPSLQQCAAAFVGEWA